MSVMSADAPTKKSRHHSPRGGEYVFYFSIIFLAAIPFAFLMCALSTLRLVKKNEFGPLKAAWMEASNVTPKIFWA